MAKKFFNQKVKKKRKKINSLYIIIGICVLFIIIAIIFIISLSSSKDHKNAVIQIRPTVTVELNSKSLDKTLFFTELSNVTEDDIKISQNYDLSTIGEYTIEIEVFNKKFTSTLEVVDTESPVVVTKDLTIAKGENYTASDFVNKCNDNSGDDCLIEFYTLGVDENATAVDYSKYSEVGTYIVQIIAKDKSGNSTTPVNATLIIKDDLSDPDPEVGATSCKYGNSDYDTTKYVLASDITTNGCAVDLNLYQSETAQAPAKKMITNDEDKIKNEFKTLNLNVTDIYLNSTLTPIINLTGNGIVGYGIEITQSIINSKGEKEVITKYQLKTDGSRIYSINKYNLK